jgi:hypothetical protein
MPFDRVRTLADLDSLDPAEILEGYVSAERGDPEPGPNRGRGVWHGWRCRMIDHGDIPNDPIHLALTAAYVARGRAQARGGGK